MQQRNQTQGLYECPICNVEFLDSEFFSNHCFHEHDLTMYFCKYCDGFFISQGEFETHKNKFHPFEEGFFICGKCKLKFPTKVELNLHILDHLPNNEISPQPQPSNDTGKPILPLVLMDLIQRAEFGEKKYGTQLRTWNGRNSLIDAYQESLDLCMYLRQKIEEGNEIGN